MVTLISIVNLVTAITNLITAIINCKTMSKDE